VSKYACYVFTPHCILPNNKDGVESIDRMKTPTKAIFYSFALMTTAKVTLSFHFTPKTQGPFDALHL